MSSKTYMVTGMTCKHCAASVEEEILEIPGVESVTADADTGKVDVSGTELSDDDIDAAVREAGYTLQR